MPPRARGALAAAALYALASVASCATWYINNDAPSLTLFAAQANNDNGGVLVINASLTGSGSPFATIPNGHTLTIQGAAGGCDGTPYCTLDQQFLARHLVVGDNTVVTLRRVVRDAGTRAWPSDALARGARRVQEPAPAERRARDAGRRTDAAAE